MCEPIKVLFICTGNACRSQMAEALLRHRGGDRFEARSAGSDPAGMILPLALATMQRMGVSTEGQYSKSWNTFADDENDIIITVCDHAAQRPCPTWVGHPATAHWPLPDPTFAPGSDEDRSNAAAEVARRLEHWISQLLTLPLDRLTPDQLKSELGRIGRG